MDRFTKYLLLGAILMAFLSLMWASWQLNQTIKEINQTIQEMEQVDKRIKELEKGLQLSMGMSSGYHVSDPYYCTRSYAIAVGGGPDKYVTEITTE